MTSYIAELYEIASTVHYAHEQGVLCMYALHGASLYHHRHKQIICELNVQDNLLLMASCGVLGVRRINYFLSICTSFIVTSQNKVWKMEIAPQETKLPRLRSFSSLR